MYPTESFILRASRSKCQYYSVVRTSGYTALQIQLIFLSFCVLLRTDFSLQLSVNKRKCGRDLSWLFSITTVFQLLCFSSIKWFVMPTCLCNYVFIQLNPCGELSSPILLVGTTTDQIFSDKFDLSNTNTLSITWLFRLWTNELL